MTGSPKLTPDQLAHETGVELAYIRELIEAGALRPDAAGLHAPADILQVRLVQALAASGVELDDVVWAIREAGLPLDQIGSMWTVAESSGRTFAELCESLGERGEQLPAVYAAFGVAVPAPDTVLRRDEEEALTRFLEVWGMLDDGADTFVRAARIAGEGVRRLELALIDLFDELGGPPPVRLRRGLPPEEAMRPSQLISGSLEQTIVWLHRRHTAHEVFERVVAAVERALARSGRRELPPSEPPAVAFVDLAGYTALAAEAGDERAAEVAAVLHSLALDAAREHDGRVVKLLGDGVMLRYPSTRAAVASVAALMRTVRAAGLPPAHAGVATGPIVSRDGDVYGHTVNLAARLAGQAAANELFLFEEFADAAAEAGFECERTGPAELKGVTGPVRVARVRVPDD